MTKATTAEGDDIRRSFNWVMSRRGLLKVYDDRLACGDWDIPYAGIEEAVLFRTRQMLISGYVLRIKAQGQIYQFGLNPGRFWASDLPFPVERRSARLKLSWFSLTVRIVALAALGYWIWDQFFREG
ncbi:MAG: hypothetical protein AAGF01_31435 [Cyanobacteria bacterium P01_G01_bin.38]